MRAVVFVLLASLLFGTTGTAQAFGPEASVFSIGAARILIGGAALAVVAWTLARRAGRGLVVAVAPLTRAGTIVTILVGGLGVIAYQPAFFLGTSSNGVATGTLVALGSAPVLTGGLTWLLDRRFPGARWAAATIVAAAGVALLGGVTGGNGGGIDPVGLAGSLGAGLSYAVYTLASKRLLDAGWTPPSAMGAVFGTAAVFGLAVLLTTDTRWLASADGLAMAAWLGLGTVTVAYLLFGAGLRVLPAPTVSTLTLAEPLTASLLGILVLGERLAPVAWLGIAAIIAGILILVVRPRPAREVVA
ncbi:DMT family transporter [Herbiconiux sp. L3-i23]|uniref:DMT family transporter n=1 Tax=Herbiconiux sp. L3-i23 TaxID=2905871 RepID=UPI0020689D01|nr:EamA family transporter [Herbiconiux sp. L3-i23]BDI23126.1 putative transporter YwfM [Herbiconiux sp. L3-i23]